MNDLLSGFGSFHFIRYLTAKAPGREGNSSRPGVLAVKLKAKETRNKSDLFLGRQGECNSIVLKMPFMGCVAKRLVL
jgi:hypothetical protein